jgi:putative hydrolase
MTPTEALERAVHCFDRAHDHGFRARAFQRALDTVRATPPDELAERASAGTLTSLPHIGDATAKVITEALQGGIPAYLVQLEAATIVPLSAGGAPYRSALRGDCHLHSSWSDGSAPIATMARTAASLGHDYIVMTDHSARLTVAHGLNRERLGGQLAEIAHLNAQLAPFRILTGMEVDILEDGSLDLDDDLLAQLDLVVASVHSKLRMDAGEMTERMIAAVTSPHVDVLGHCTGRLIGKRPESRFDAGAVLSACARTGTAVEINCRPERVDPPDELIRLAVELGCWFTIDSDAHSTGQLEWLALGCDRAAANGVPIDRIANALGADDLLTLVAR